MITSSSNTQIKNIINLMSKAKYRNKQGEYVVEGIKMFLEVSQDKIVKVYISENSVASMDKNVLDKVKSTGYELVSEQVFKNMSGTVTPQGILAVAKMDKYDFDAILKNTMETSTFIVLEDIQDPGNLGTIVRTAEAAGVSAIIMSKGTVDIYNPKVIRSTMGTIFRVPFVYVEDICEAVNNMKKQNIDIVAAHLSGNRYYDEIDYCKKTAFLIGNEGNGLSEKMSSLADNLIKIPMQGNVESLNASVASAILMYEAYRQKRTLSKETVSSFV